MTDIPPLHTFQRHPEKYGHVERERRYLLHQMPPDLMAQPERRHIIDRYLLDTTLRLRHISHPATDENIWKLTQKARVAPTDGTRILITTLYLSEQEHALFLNLSSRQIVKDRYIFNHGGRRYGIDVFHEALAGLILAETECGSDEEMQRLALPDFAAIDVSHREALTGGALAALTSEEAQILLTQLQQQ